MPNVTAIHFTQEQARTLTGVSVETMRHWRRSIPYLASKPGKSARFTFADVVGLAVTRELIDLGVRIASVSAGVEALLQLLAQSPGILESGVALVTTSGALVVRSEELTGLRLDQSGLVVPLVPLITRIREYMLPSMPAASDQASLPFPPQLAKRGI
jgi:DNA-binding transcriptional MerR regulator